MRKLIAIAKHLLGEENNFANDAILLQPGSDGFISGGEILVNLREALMEAEHTIDGLESGWAAYEKARMVDPKPGWNLPLWFLLLDQNKTFFLASDIGTLEIRPFKEHDDFKIDNKSKAVVNFTAPDGKEYTLRVWTPTYITRVVLYGENSGMVTVITAISKALCGQFGHINVTTIGF
jgi:hypothetical protein